MRPEYTEFRTRQATIYGNPSLRKSVIVCSVFDMDATKQSPSLISFNAWMKANNLNPRKVSIAAGVPYSSISDFVRGDTYDLSSRNQQKIADAFDLSTEDIFRHAATRPNVTQKRAVPIIGEVFAGPEGNYMDPYSDGAHPLLEIELDDDDVATIIRGRSMWPRFKDGEIAIFGRRYDDPIALIGQEVMVALDDGRRMVKVLSRTGGAWLLSSINSDYPPISDVRIEWARPFKWLVSK